MFPRVEEREVGYLMLPELCIRTLGNVWNTGLSWIVSRFGKERLDFFLETGSEVEICM